MTVVLTISISHFPTDALAGCLLCCFIKLLKGTHKKSVMQFEDCKTAHKELWAVRGFLCVGQTWCCQYLCFRGTSCDTQNYRAYAVLSSTFLFFCSQQPYMNWKLTLQSIGGIVRFRAFHQNILATCRDLQGQVGSTDIRAVGYTSHRVMFRSLLDSECSPTFLPW